MSPPSLAARVRKAAARLAGVARATAAVAGRGGHPTVDGRIGVASLERPVEVLRDAFGVPHVFAGGEADACFGQGFVHAQDRLFQMDAMRRLALGCLAEIGGVRLLDSDRFMRRLGLADRAGRDFAQLAERDRVLLEAYASGVNAGVRSLPALPPEYAVTGVPPRPWHPEHSLLLGRLLLFTFAFNWDTELLRERLLQALGAERAWEVDPAYPAHGVTATGAPHAAAGERLLASLRAAHEAGLPVGGASNAWALSGARTASGAPLLASDPHLQSQLPGLFHVAHLVGGAFDVIGAGIAGLPGAMIGHNGRVAWGLTAGMADVSDCYVETIHPDDPTQYRTPEGWATGRTRIERIQVLNGDTVEERVLETRHGPVIGPALTGEPRAIALHTTALEGSDLIGPFLDLCRADTVERFEQAAAGWPGSTFNVVWAHRDGGIGYRLAGSVPRREHGEGLLPRDGATSPGPPPPWPAAAMPRAVDPPDGALYSANNASGGEIELGEEWCEPFRAERIAGLLDARDRHTVASMQAIQRDVRSAPLQALRDLVLAAGAVESDDVCALLETWNGDVAVDSAAAAIIETVYAEVARVLVTRVAGEYASTVLGGGLAGVSASSTFHYRLQGRLLDVLRQPREPWLAGIGDRDRVLRTATVRAVEELRIRLGEQAREWSWGTLHELRLDHPLRAVPGLGRLMSRGPYPYGGDVNTISQGGFSVYDGPRGTGYSPAYRQVIDLADFDRSTFSLPAGNSGVPGHARYDDCIADHLAGRQRPLLYSRAVVERHTEHRLRLEPALPGDGAAGDRAP